MSVSPAEPCMVHSGQVEKKFLSGGVAVRDILMEDIVIGEADFPEEKGIATHTHPTCHEVIIISEGTSEFHWGDGQGRISTEVADAGTYVFVPRGIPHGFRSIRGEMRMIFIYLCPKDTFSRDFVAFRDGAWAKIGSVDF